MITDLVAVFPTMPVTPLPYLELGSFHVHCLTFPTVCKCSKSLYEWMGEVAFLSQLR